MFVFDCRHAYYRYAGSNDFACRLQVKSAASTIVNKVRRQAFIVLNRGVLR